ncbi:hypothetical protein D3C78_1491990 [compost metagenome]
MSRFRDWRPVQSESVFAFRVALRLPPGDGIPEYAYTNEAICRRGGSANSLRMAIGSSADSPKDVDLGNSRNVGQRSLELSWFYLYIAIGYQDRNVDSSRAV